MKLKINTSKYRVTMAACLLGCLLLLGSTLNAQDSTAIAEEVVPAKPKPVKNTFQSIWIIDNQTVMVPVKKTFEMDIQHRFGTVENGYDDFWGFFAPSNIRMGFSYVPVNKLNLGIGITKTTAAIIPEQGPSSVNGPLWDASLKYSIITQTKGISPVSLTYYGNISYNTKKDPDKEIYRNYSDRMNFFNQLIIARKISDKLSVQVAPSLTHQNVVNGYYVKLNDSTLQVEPDMMFNHFAIALSARYKLTDVTSVMINYDQPITKHVSNNPNPSLSFGLEFNTSSHSFQVFATNYFYLVPQINNLYNTNPPFSYTDAEGNKIKGGKFLIGFNITRLWNY
ncbi:MAG TPA: DUF5777 family beta-barrel protein [Chitinophagaceae bacterium]